MREAELSMLRRVGTSEENMLALQGNLADTYHSAGRLEKALRVRRDVFSGFMMSLGDSNEHTIIAALNLSTSLTDTGRFAEARAFMPDQMALAKRILGSDHPLTLDFQWGWARALLKDVDVTAEQLAEAASTLEKALKIAQRVLGHEHPSTCNYRRYLEYCKIQIARRGVRA